MDTLLDTLSVEGGQLPGPRDEAWRSTSLRALERRAFQRNAPAPDTWARETVAHIPAPRIVFVNGHYNASGSQLDQFAKRVRFAPENVAAARDEDIFDAANRLHAKTGLQLDIAAGEDAGTLHLVCIGTAAEHDQLWHLRHRITLGEGAKLRLIEHDFAASSHAHFDNSHFETQIADNAELRHLRVQDDAASATRMLHTVVHIGTNARYRRLDLEFGAALSRHVLDVTMQGEGAEVLANGVQLGDGRRHLDTRLGVVHAVGDTRCTLGWRGLATDRSKIAFHGGIRIEAGADGSVADLSQRNLLLSEQAECSAQPVLEIYTDEVQAAHGTTVGELDQKALFYLRSRGIPADAARRLLTAAFCRDALSILENDDARVIAETALDAALHRVQGE